MRYLRLPEKVIELVLFIQRPVQGTQSNSFILLNIFYEILWLSDQREVPKRV